MLICEGKAEQSQLRCRSGRHKQTAPTGQDFMRAVNPYVPEGITKSRLNIGNADSFRCFNDAMRELGQWSEISRTILSICMWSAAYHLDNYEAALWWTVKGLGDLDTTCAMLGALLLYPHLKSLRPGYKDRTIRCIISKSSDTSSFILAIPFNLSCHRNKSTYETFGDVRAVDSIDLRVGAGEI